MNLQQLNALSEKALSCELLKCCGSKNWLAGVLACRPYLTEKSLYTLSDTIWDGLSKVDYLEAFAQHPQIGNLATLKEKFSNTSGWASDEQQGANQASTEVLQALHHGNQAYLQKFGYIFIVCATGKSAGQMLELLEQRLTNEAQAELSIAAAEQNKITKLRLKKLLCLKG
ncbi:MAG: 2-oxo-4-hydroxy-4-carboxy-5-ureidoimidazoline decarboxylase [Xanthomonadales bacterium]|nr:2-oxo-4-hydroxy-4-carboxy-5-ureidoimidazoline decarboxylase [Xanthomonadales bacterium]